MLNTAFRQSLRSIANAELRNDSVLFRKGRADDGFGTKTENLQQIGTPKCIVQPVQRLPMTPVGGAKEKYVSNWIVVFAYGTDVRAGDIVVTKDPMGNDSRFELDSAYDSDVGAFTTKFYAYKVD